MLRKNGRTATGMNSPLCLLDLREFSLATTVRMITLWRTLWIEITYPAEAMDIAEGSVLHERLRSLKLLVDELQNGCIGRGAEL